MNAESGCFNESKAQALLRRNNNSASKRATLLSPNKVESIKQKLIKWSSTWNMGSIESGIFPYRRARGLFNFHVAIHLQIHDPGCMYF